MFLSNNLNGIIGCTSREALENRAPQFDTATAAKLIEDSLNDSEKLRSEWEKLRGLFNNPNLMVDLEEDILKALNNIQNTGWFSWLTKDY